MADHVAVRVIDTQKTVAIAANGSKEGIGHFRGFHPRALVEGDVVGGHFLPRFQCFRYFFRIIAVPEIGDMAEFLGFCAGELVDALGDEKFRQGVCDFRRVDEVMLGNVEIAVIFKNTGVVDVRTTAAIKIGEVLIIKGHGHLDGTVATEIVENESVAVLDRADGGAVFADDKGREVLVDLAGFFAQGAVSFRCRREQAAVFDVSVHLGIPTAFDHVPVGLIAIHGDDHASAAAGDGSMEGVIV